MSGMDRFKDKDRRRQRRRNEVARELANPRYRQRVVPGKRTERETPWADEALERYIDPPYGDPDF